MFGGTVVGPSLSCVPSGFVMDSIPVTNETWKWDGTNWTLLHPRFAPSPRTVQVMAYDPISQQVIVLNGGHANGDPAQQDMWAWDGNTWTELHPTTLPRWCEGYSAAFDPDLNALVVPACNQTLQLDFSHFWSWNGFDWTYQTASGSAPAPRFWYAFAYDSDRQQDVLAGGCEGEGLSPCPEDTWLLTHGAWSQAPAQGAMPMGLGVAAYDDYRHQLVEILADAAKSRASMATVLETWLWDGKTWTMKTPVYQPSGYLVYDPRRKQVLAFGGGREIWGWDGSDWVQVV